MADEKQEPKAKKVEVNDLPEKELEENELDKVSGGCTGMSQDPAGGISRLNIRSLPGDTLKINPTINTTEIVK